MLDVSGRATRRARGRAATAGAALVLAAALTLPATAGPWMQPKGESYTRFGISYLYTDTEFDSDGHEVPLLTTNPLVLSAAYRQIDVFAYHERGLSPRVTFVGYLPFKIATSKRTETSEDASLIRDIDVSNGGLSDLYFGARTPLARGRYPVAVEAGVKVPLGYERIPDNGGPALGTGYADAQASLLAGTSGRAGYATVGATYRVRGGDLADEIGFAAQIGGATGAVSAQALLEGWYATVDPEPLDVSATLAVPNQDVIKLSFAAGYEVAAGTRVAAEAIHVLDGKNTATGTTASLSLVLVR